MQWWLLAALFCCFQSGLGEVEVKEEERNWKRKIEQIQRIERSERSGTSETSEKKEAGCWTQ